MPKSCCVVECSNHNIIDKELLFHLLSMDPERWRKWVNAVKWQLPQSLEWTPATTTILCCEHFLS